MTQLPVSTIRRLEDVLYLWACGKTSAESVHVSFRFYGVSIDLRQKIIGNQMEAFDSDGNAVYLEV